MLVIYADTSNKFRNVTNCSNVNKLSLFQPTCTLNLLKNYSSCKL